MTEYGKIKTAKEGPRFTITLNYPERRNAIGPQMANELLYALEEAANDSEVRVIVLAGEGKAFCAGGDFQQMTGGAAAYRELPPKGDYADLLLAMIQSTKPIIARVHGDALGGGLGLVVASHFAVGGAAARLGTPEIDVGLFPMMIMAVLGRIMPRRALLRMMLLGEKYTGDQAAALGLLTQWTSESVGNGAPLDDVVGELVKGLSAKSPAAMRLGLRAFADQDDLTLEQALPLLRQRLSDCLATDDAREGLTAFLEKRAPKWTGR
jgi:enoyl-CoA hydratase/carnithine racemase